MLFGELPMGKHRTESENTFTFAVSARHPELPIGLITVPDGSARIYPHTDVSLVSMRSSSMSFMSISKDVLGFRDFVVLAGVFVVVVVTN